MFLQKGGKSVSLGSPLNKIENSTKTGSISSSTGCKVGHKHTFLTIAIQTMSYSKVSNVDRNEKNNPVHNLQQRISISYKTDFI